MEQRSYKANEIEILYNIYGKFIHIVRKEEKFDGDVSFYEFDTGEQLDLENYAIHGYKMIRDKGHLINRFKEYTVKELSEIEESFDKFKPERKEIQSEFLIDLNWLMDKIEQGKYDYDMPYPVERIEIRYSELLQDYIFLFVVFDHAKGRLAYLDLGTGYPVEKEILDLYTLYPRDEILKKPSYTPREIIDLRVQLNKGVRSLGRRV